MQMLPSNNLYLLDGKILDKQAWWCLYNKVGNISLSMVMNCCVMDHCNSVHANR